MTKPERCAMAGVPKAVIAPRSKGEIALAELDRLRAADVRFGVVLADAGYGTSAAFRHGLDARGLSSRHRHEPEGLLRRRAARAANGPRPQGMCRTRSRETPRRSWQILLGGA